MYLMEKKQASLEKSERISYHFNTMPKLKTCLNLAVLAVLVVINDPYPLALLLDLKLNRLEGWNDVLPLSDQSTAESLDIGNIPVRVARYGDGNLSKLPLRLILIWFVCDPCLVGWSDAQLCAALARTPTPPRNSCRCLQVTKPEPIMTSASICSWYAFFLG